MLWIDICKEQCDMHFRSMQYIHCWYKTYMERILYDSCSLWESFFLNISRETTYLKLVGYNSGVNKNIKPNDPVIPNFPIKLKIIDTVSKVVLLSVRKYKENNNAILQIGLSAYWIIWHYKNTIILLFETQFKEQRKPLQCQNSPKNCKKKHTQKTYTLIFNTYTRPLTFLYWLGTGIVVQCGCAKLLSLTFWSNVAGANKFHGHGLKPHS